MYGWLLRGKCGFGSGVWHLAAMYSASLMQRFSARLDEVRRVQVRSVDRNQVAWGPRGVSCSLGLPVAITSLCALPSRVPGIRQRSCQIVMRPDNSDQSSAAPRSFGKSRWRWRLSPPLGACAPASARSSRHLRRAAAANGCAPRHRQSEAFGYRIAPSSRFGQDGPCRRSSVVAAWGRPRRRSPDLSRRSPSAAQGW